MFNDIDDKIKGLAYIVFWLSIIAGGIWLIYSFTKLSDYNDYIQYHNITDMFDSVYNAKAGIKSSIILIVSGVISSFFIYGFGEITYRLISIDSSMKDKDMQEKVDKHNEEHKKAIENIQYNDSSYN